MQADRISEDASSWGNGALENFNDQFMLEIYQYFVNQMSSGSDGLWRRKRKRKRKKKLQGRRKWEPKHFVKIVSCSPTPSRPLQGLWKGICEDDVSLAFYLVAYDDFGLITCRRVGDSSEPLSGYSPVLWKSNTRFFFSQLSPEEVYLYDSRVHLTPLVAANCNLNEPNPTEDEAEKRVLHIISSYYLVPALAGNSVYPGRAWQYENGTIGFGFLRNLDVWDIP